MKHMRKDLQSVSRATDMPMILPPPPELDLASDFRPIMGSWTRYVLALVSCLGVAYVWSQILRTHLDTCCIVYCYSDSWL